MYAMYARNPGGIAKEDLEAGESHILDRQFSFHTCLSILD